MLTAQAVNIAAELEAIENEHGQLRPEDVVNVASRPDHPLHDCFEWDDSVAAEQYRIDQARTLIRSVRYEIQVNETQVRAVKYVRDESAPEKVARYMNVTKLTEEELIARTLETEVQRIKALIERGRGIAANLQRAAEFDALLRQVVA